MGSVGGPRHYRGAGLPGQAWQCSICGHLNVAAGACAKCQDDPNWAPAQPKPTGLQAARAALAKITASAPPPESPPEEQLDVRVSLVTQGGVTSAVLQGPTGESYHGQGATRQEALLDALAAMEEDLTRPKCPTCGQAWPEELEYPSTE